MASLNEAYGSRLHMFSHIPRSVRASEISKTEKSIYIYDTRGKVAATDEALTREVLSIG